MAGLTLKATVVTDVPNGFRLSYHTTLTAADGRYQFPQLSGHRVIVDANSSTHRQVCGGFAVLGVTTQLDVEVTSRTNPQPSPTRPPVRVTGQIYEMTPDGRVGVSGAEVWVSFFDGPAHLASQFPTASDGRYDSCGIPSDLLIAFEAWKDGYEPAISTFQHFNADSTLDLEMKRTIPNSK